MSHARSGFVLILMALGVSLVSGATGGTPANTFGGATPLQWSGWLTDLEIARRGDGPAWKQGGNRVAAADWNKDTITLLSFRHLNSHRYPIIRST